jgi:predicted RNase H-like HicB family nuclease
MYTVKKERAMKGTGYIILTIMFQREGRKWLAQCVELGTATLGRTLIEAKKRINEAISLHLNTLEDVNELERFFRENNIIFYSAKPKPKSIPVSVPLDENTFTQTHLQPIPLLHAHA